MKIILRQDFDSLGKTGDVVTVKNGYARNYLIPQGVANLATRKNMQLLEEELKIRERQLGKDRVTAESLAEELSKVSLTAPVAVGEEEKIFGSVTSQDIAGLLKEKGYDIDKKKIQLTEPIKALGIYTVDIKLHTEVIANVRIWVVKE
ncbi:50S ribosomal protein L9 [bacterium]|nr:50S ribosomal protein L9 [bacterium]